MPSRRALLGAGTTTTVTALAGCTTVFGSDGTHEFDHDGDSLPTADTTVAASDSTDWQPEEGYIDANGLVHELDDDSGFVLVTEYRVESHGDDWLHSRFQTKHEWSLPTRTEVAEFDSNTRRTDEDPQFDLDVEERGESIEWELSLVDPKTRPLTYQFASKIEDANPQPGDRIADVRFFAEYEEDGFLGAERETGSSLRLDYGDGAAEDWESDR